MSKVILTYRRPLVGLAYITLWTLSFVGAFLLRFDFSIPPSYLEQFALWLPALLLARVIAFSYFGLFRGMWRYTGTHDLIALANSLAQTSPDAAQAIGVLQMVQGLAQRETGADGKPVDKFKVDFPETGSVTVNGKPLAGMMP